jgi:hypothetical protein
LITTGIAWNSDRYDLTKEPGRQHLRPLTFASAKYFITFGAQNLTSSSSLAVVRGIGVAAVSISPAPFPATHGELLLPPVSQFHVGISVSNTGFVEQPVTLNVTLTPTNGPHPTVRQHFHLNLAPLQSYAVVPKDFATVPSERATLVISVVGCSGRREPDDDADLQRSDVAHRRTRGGHRIGQPLPDAVLPAAQRVGAARDPRSSTRPCRSRTRIRCSSHSRSP